jgi:hypothetical protein
MSNLPSPADCDDTVVIFPSYHLWRESLAIHSDEKSSSELVLPFIGTYISTTPFHIAGTEVPGTVGGTIILASAGEDRPQARLRQAQSHCTSCDIDGGPRALGRH